jgi:uncharacterized membrane protein
MLAGAIDCMLVLGGEGAAMHVWMDGSDWVWMSFMMVLWIAVLGAAIYLVVRLANDRQATTSPRRRGNAAASR